MLRSGVSRLSARVSQRVGESGERSRRGLRLGSAVNLERAGLSELVLCDHGDDLKLGALFAAKVSARPFQVIVREGFAVVTSAAACRFLASTRWGVTYFERVRSLAPPAVSAALS